MNNHASMTTPTVTHAPVATAGLAQKVSIRNLDFFYGASKALKSISIPLYQGKVTAFIGPLRSRLQNWLLSPVKRSGAVSPLMRAIASSTPVTMPALAAR